MYLDSSAFLKLVVEERESAALRAWLAQDGERVSSALLRVEAERGAARYSAEARRRVRTALDGVVLVPLDDPVLDVAARLDPPELRSLDALHLATALSLGPALHGFVCYDHRLAGAAADAGLLVHAPA